MKNRLRFYGQSKLQKYRQCEDGESGVDGVAHWVNEFFGLKGDERISKIKVHKVARWVMDQYEQDGRITAISDEELEEKVQELMPDAWTKYRNN